MVEPLVGNYEAASADPDLGVGKELVGRQRKIGWRRPAPNAARGVVLRAVAGAEEAVILARVRERDATEMRADADQHQPLVVARLDAGLVGLRIWQARDV